jgi:hypothetical protein
LTNFLAPIEKEFKEEKVDDVWDTMDSFDGIFLEEAPNETNFDVVHSESGTGLDVLVVSAILTSTS